MNLEHAYGEYRSLLFSIAYRLLGTVTEAEDVVQDVFLALQSAPEPDIGNLKSYLAKAATNRCLNILSSARKKRETYVGPWLPEQLQTPHDDGEHSHRLEVDETLSFAYMVMLERLTPDERVVFVLRDVFAYAFSDIADAIQKSEDNCRKILSRARAKMKDARPDAELHPSNTDATVLSFIEAIRQDRIPDVVHLLSDHVTLITDGGGKAKAAMREIAGIKRVFAFLQGIASKKVFDVPIAVVPINGGTAMARLREDGTPMSVWSFELDPATGRIARIYGVYNPDKLKHLDFS